MAVEIAWREATKSIVTLCDVVQSLCDKKFPLEERRTVRLNMKYHVSRSLSRHHLTALHTTSADFLHTISISFLRKFFLCFHYTLSAYVITSKRVTLQRPLLMYFSASVTSSNDPMMQGTWSCNPLGDVSRMRPVPVEALPPA